ncbi:MAG: hypothetical protein CMJ84_17275 [Planctomycetes bacterium]|jgi:uncharacterized protein (DUF1501 family)|nr:hypothetical protein [Planctomycetota bacterium]
MKRRSFLKATALTSGAVCLNVAGFRAAARAQFGPGSNPVLVVIFLRGGQDQLNTVIPYNDKNYYAIRPSCAIEKEKVIPLDDQWAFHPAFAPMKEWYDKGKMAAIINAGSPHSTRSHFDAQDFMEFAAPGNRTVRDGWLNRYLTATMPDANKGYGLPELRTLGMQELLPRSLRGRYPVLAVPNNLDGLQETLDLFEGFYGGDKKKDLAEVLKKSTNVRKGVAADPVMTSGRETIYGLRRLQQLLEGEGVEEGLGDTAFQEYPGGHFASRLQKLARVIRADVGLEIAATDVGGWDHHVGLGSVDGALQRMLTFMSEGLSAFMTDLGKDLDRTMVLMCTEFGRNAEENGNAGSDHGHGGAMWLLGGKLNGGKIYGKWTGLQKSVLYQKRDMPVTTDFRDAFAEVLQGHMKFEAPDGFFPDYQAKLDSLGLFG